MKQHICTFFLMGIQRHDLSCTTIRLLCIPKSVFFTLGVFGIDGAGIGHGDKKDG
jgi:hypothetical protein